MGYTGKGGAPEAWTVSEAPERYVELLKKNIIGIHITIDRLQGKFKMSQEMRLGDRDGIVQGFKDLGTDIGTEMSDMVQQRSDIKEQVKASS